MIRAVISLFVGFLTFVTVWSVSLVIADEIMGHKKFSNNPEQDPHQHMGILISLWIGPFISLIVSIIISIFFGRFKTRYKVIISIFELLVLALAYLFDK
jgi:Na+/melibiose symporter-like transporter